MLCRWCKQSLPVGPPAENGFRIIQIHILQCMAWATGTLRPFSDTRDGQQGWWNVVWLRANINQRSFNTFESVATFTYHSDCNLYEWTHYNSFDTSTYPASSFSYLVAQARSIRTHYTDIQSF